MLFQKRFHSGIRDGSITLTFRNWQAPRVTVGRQYRLGAAGRLEVEAIDEVTISSISDESAQRAGFRSASDLVAFLRKASADRLTAKSRVFRVAFRFVGDRPEPHATLREDTSARSLDEVGARLGRMDRLSRRGPWTMQVLALIDEHPRTAASRLAPRIGRETPKFKADVRKLKQLGLTRSFEVGYELTPRGRALLARGL